MSHICCRVAIIHCCMRITHDHVVAFMEIRDRSFGTGVSSSGVVCLREGRASTRVINDGSSVAAADLFEGKEGELAWRTSVPSFSSGALAEILLCWLHKQTPLHAVILDATVFWTITLGPTSHGNMGSVLRCLVGVGDVHSCLERINVALCGVGKIERSPYMVVEDPSLAGVYAFFRRNKCDVDWVKRQVYGEMLVHVPETFPTKVATPEDISKRIAQQRES